MPKVTWGVKGSQIDEVERGDGPDYEPYDGPIPPKGVYRLKVERMEYVQFSSGNKGLKMLLLVDDPNKKKYAGAPIWDNLVVVEQNDWKLAQFLDAIGATGKDWDGTVIGKDDQDRHVVQKIGRVNASGLYIKASTKMGTNQDGDPRAEIARYIVKGEAETADDSDAGDDGEAPF